MRWQSRSGQAGATLISTMVGLMLGLMASVAVLMAYRTIALQSGAANGASLRTALGSTALFAAQADLQRAGFGVESSSSNCAGSAQSSASGTANTDFVLLSGASLSAAGALTGTATTIAAAGGTLQTGNALIWHWLEGSTHRCAGLVAGSSTAGGLKTLRPVNCTAATAWSTTTWTGADYIPAGQFTGSSALQFSAIRSTSCWPYGKGPASGATPGLLVTLSVGTGSVYTLCLPNICK